jgi:serine/threonine protein kinase
MSKRLASAGAEMSLKKYFTVLKQVEGEFFPARYELYDFNQTLTLVLPYYARGNLLAVIRRVRGFSEMQASHLLYLLMMGVRRLHKKGLLHNNIKPSNMLFMDSEAGLNLVLTDMVTNDQAGDCSTLFDAFFKAPECFGGALAERSDVYSCGAVLHFMLTGRPPVVGASIEEVVERVKAGQREGIQDGVSSAALELCDQMLKTNPIYRPSLEECLNHKWFSEVKTRGYPDLPTVQKLTRYSFCKTIVSTIRIYSQSKGLLAKESVRISEAFVKKAGAKGDKMPQDSLVNTYVGVTTLRK